MEEYKIKRIKTSINNLCIVYFTYMCSYQPEKAIDTFKDIIEFYLKFKEKNYIDLMDHTKYKLNWLIQDKRTDQFYLPKINELYNKVL